MTKEQMEAFRAADGRSAPATSGTGSRAWTCRRTNSRRSSSACPFATPADAGGAGADRAGRCGAGRRCRCRSWPGAQMSTQGGFGDILAEIGRGQGELKELAEHIVTTSPGRDGFHQSGAVGEPARHLRPAYPQRRVPRRQAGERAALGHVAEGPAHRTRHRRAEPVSAAGRGGVGAGDDRGAGAAGRHGVRSVRQPRPRCADLRLLPGCAVPAGVARRRG